MIKLKRTERTATAMIVLALGWFCYCACGSLNLRNYDNDPNMAKAMEYDLGENHSDYDKADRAKAKQYYLAYLEDVNESFQRARVYDHLGALYATGSNPRKGEKADYDKARYYFRKVLELEPVRIARPTIRARVVLASIDKFGSDRIWADMDVYEWLRSIDEEKMRKLWLPLTPDDQGPTGVIIRATKNLQESLYKTLETNIMAVMKHLPNAEAEQFLLEIVDRFAGSELDKLARQHADQRAISLSDKPTTKPAEPKVQTPGQEPPGTAEHERRSLFYVLAGAVVAAVLIAALLLKREAPRK